MDAIARQGLMSVIYQDITEWIDDTYCYETPDEYQDRMRTEKSIECMTDDQD